MSPAKKITREVHRGLRFTLEEYKMVGYLMERENRTEFSGFVRELIRREYFRVKGDRG